MDELRAAMEGVSTCVLLAASEKLLKAEADYKSSLMKGLQRPCTR
ncbi:aspartate transaminase [Cutibacterium acnes JCM 18918]|nr:aspartate transaminase [Cutibacterium acnes JCM 18918]